jgi:serine/threonine-protein kinase
VTAPIRFRAQRALEDRYLIGRELGQGGMAVVFQAEDRASGAAVAIKLLLPAVASQVGVARFTREIELARRLEHPHILRVLDTGEADGLPFYVMPFITGAVLRARLRLDATFPLADAVTIGTQVADALAYAHAEGILHRDIKPENLLLEDGPRVIVADFGVGKALSASGASSLTETGFVVGTPAYMSPEQAAGDPALDGRSDLYSLGVVLYELIGGRLPFTGRTAQQVIASRFTTTPVALSTLRPDVPRTLAAVVEELLAVRASDRIPSADALGDRLRTERSRLG